VQKRYDYLIVGAGLFGAVCARELWVVSCFYCKLMKKVLAFCRSPLRVRT
jgi:UDP-galactopyranose mutase